MSGNLWLLRGIDLTVTAQGGSIVKVAIGNQRPLGLASHLIGTTPDEALVRIATLFSICRIAQGVAGCIAVEEAWGVEIAPGHKAARDFLLRGETVMEHATCALLTWPGLLRQQPKALSALKLLRSSLADLWRVLYPDGDWMRPGGGRLAPDKPAIEARLANAERALEEADLRLAVKVKGWRDSLIPCGPIGNLIFTLEAEGLAGCGISDIALLGDLDRRELDHHLSSDREGSYAAQPELQGAPRETGPLARRRAEPLLQEMIAEHGPGLAARFFAQSIDTTRCLEEMGEIAGKISAANKQQIVQHDGCGLGIVEAARGWLVHRVEITNGRIHRFQVVAPTEWNFHPRGPFALGLINGRPGPPPERFAQWMVAALDPCVPCQLTMEYLDDLCVPHYHGLT